MNGACNGNFFAPPPGALGKGQTVIYHLISITKSISKIFIPSCVCVLTNEKNKTYQTGFLFCCLGHALGCDFEVLRVQESNSVPSSVRLSPPKSLDQIQPNEVCELLTCMGRVTAKINLALGRGQKVK